MNSLNGLLLITLMVIITESEAWPRRCTWRQRRRCHPFDHFDWITCQCHMRRHRSLDQGCSDFDLILKNGLLSASSGEQGILNQAANRVFVHHSNVGSCGSLSKDTQGFQKPGLKGNDYDDAGYNFLIGSDGAVYEGRGWDTVGAHTYGWNKNSVGIAFIGDYVDSLPSKSALITLSKFLECGVNSGKLLENYKLHGHRDGVCFDESKDKLYEYVQGMVQYGGRLVDC